MTVQIGVSAAYQGQAVCNVAATDNAKSNVGDEVIISVSEGADGGP